MYQYRLAGLAVIYLRFIIVIVASCVGRLIPLTNKKNVKKEDIPWRSDEIIMTFSFELSMYMYYVERDTYHTCLVF